MPTSTPPHRRRLLLVAAAVAWLLAATSYLIAEGIAAAAFDDYSYAENWISDLGIPDVTTTDGRAVDSPRHAVMNVGFVLHGALFLLGALLLAPAIDTATHAGRRWVVVLAGTHLLGMTLLGLFPSGPRAEADGTIVLHQAGALLAIVGGNLAIIAAGMLLRRTGRPGLGLPGLVLGVVGIACFVLLLVDGAVTSVEILPDGVWERLAVYSVTLWQVLAALALLGSEVVKFDDRPRSRSGHSDVAGSH